MNVIQDKGDSVRQSHTNVRSLRRRMFLRAFLCWPAELRKWS